MLSHGMKVIKGSLLATFLLVVVLFIISSIIYVKRKNNDHTDSVDYFEKIQVLLEDTSHLKVEDIFEFEFDKAYVASEVYGDEKYFTKKLGVSSSIDIPALETGAHNRILFVKDNRVIYDFVYYMGEMYISETGIIVYPETTIILSQQENDTSGKKIIQLLFNTGDGSVVS